MGRIWRWYRSGTDAELEARVGVGAREMAAVRTGLETSVVVMSVGVGALERERELVRGLELVLARG
jgi:hypothetical protein